MSSNIIPARIKFVQDVIAFIGDDAVCEEMEILGWRGHDSSDIPGFIEDYIGEIDEDFGGFLNFNERVGIIESDFSDIADKYGLNVDENFNVTDGVPR